MSALVLGGVPIAGLAAPVSIHDPAMAQEGDTYYLFSTGPGIPFYSSKDLRTWQVRGRIFSDKPGWAQQVVSDFNGHIWAPDISFHDGLYYLYYAVSAGGRITSAIGLTTNKTLNPDALEYRWEDRGIIVQSLPGRDLWNAIDPNLIEDEHGAAWLAFGSFWSGLKLVRLNASRTALAEPQEWHSIARRERSVLLDDRDPGPAELEAPFVFRKNGYFYLFLSWGKCCLGVKSTYRLMIGRSRDVRGPYLDKAGRDLAAGGGTLLLGGTSAWPGLGGNSTYTFNGKDYLVFHAYEAADNGLQKLKIAELTWDADLWPVVDPKALQTYTSVLVP